MPIIAMVNQKGGVGKTTLATNLACALADCQTTLLLDCDPQGSAASWYALSAHNRPQLALHQAGPQTLSTRARASRANFQWTVIDCPPGITQINSEAIRASDLVIIPCKPRLWDLWACADIVSAIQLRQQTTRGQPLAAFVISMNHPRTNASRQIRSALANQNLPILSTQTDEREAYAAAAAGSAVINHRDMVARTQIRQITAEIKDLCHALHAPAQ